MPLQGVAGERAVDGAEDVGGVFVAEFGGQQVGREGLVGDGAGPALDGGGADAGEAGVGGGGVGAAVLHGGADFDAGGVAIEDEAAGFALQDVEEIGGLGEVFGGAVEGGGKLAVEALEGFLELGEAAGADEEGVGAEDFGVQATLGEEIGGIGGEDGGFALALRGIGVLVGLGDAGDAGGFFHGGEAVVEGVADAGMEHGAGRGGADGGGEFLGEGLEVGAAEGEDEAGLGAELADAHGDGGLEALDEGDAAFAEGAGEEDEGIEGAHLGEDGDGLGAGRGAIEEGAAGGVGAGEADGAGEGVADEGEADFDAGGVEEGEDAVGEAAGFEGAGDGAGDEFAGARVGAVAFDDDGAAGGEGAGGITPGGGEGQREV